MSVIHVCAHPGDVEVWLDCEGGFKQDGLVIGVGATRLEALQDAEVDLLAALDAVRVRLAREGVINHGGTMPHDKNGTLLQIGDVVTIRAKVTNISTGDEYCNVNLETVEPMYPGDYKTGIVLNAKQVEQVVAASETRETPPVEPQPA